jgi:asparagine synthase (glutamine-hydrolysing)
MCGICGIVTGDRGLVEPAVRRMMAAMVHRGPDDEGYEELPLGTDGFGPLVGFGFRRLAILDLSPTGHQPMFNTNTGDCLAFNGEIYNFRSLRAELQCRGVVFRGTSDTEVLLHALSTWGEEALGRIQGMFAFAFYEARSRRILLARDPLGIKPLYVATMPGHVAFASEIRALRASGIVSEDLDVGGIAGMLAYGAVQGPRTVYEHIRTFPAGAHQWLDARVSEGVPPSPVRRSWSFPTRTITNVDQPTAAATIRQMLHDSVLRHLVADVPVGVFLSAGIDSTIIASFAREYTPAVTAFTVGFGAIHGQDEVDLASQTARALGIKHVAVELDITNMPAKWHDWIAGMDSPSIDGFNTYVVSRRLAAEGVVVGLSGLGADELFGGYRTFVRGPRMARLLRSIPLVTPGMRGSAIRALAPVERQAGSVEKLADLVSGDPTVAGVTLSLRRTLPNRDLASPGILPDRDGLSSDFIDHSHEAFEPEFDGDPFNTVSRMELTSYMGNTLLRDTDANSMKQSLEVRVPFLDVPLVEYVSALPGRLKGDGRKATKSLLRMACRKVIRDDIARSPKTGFTLPIGAWMRGQMRDSCEEAIARLEKVPVLEGREVRRLWESFLGDERSMHWSRPLSLVVLGASIG